MERRRDDLGKAGAFFARPFGFLMTFLENRRGNFLQHVGVLKTASGFQGEQPLVHRRMWVKEFGKIDS